MGLNWIKDFSKYDINCLLLLEEKQIEWIDYEYKKEVWSKIFQEYDYIAWYFMNKCPKKKDWVLSLLKQESFLDLEEAKIMCLKMIEDWLVYITDPNLYNNLEFLKWDDKELTNLVDFDNKVIIDIGSGTGRQAFLAKNNTNTLYCVEPIGNLRKYLRNKAKSLNLTNFFVVDGLIENIPFPDEFADIVMGGHVFGDYLEDEYNELMRVVKDKGMIILIPGNNDINLPTHNSKTHKFLVEKGFSFSSFLEPTDGMKLKYWKIK